MKGIKIDSSLIVKKIDYNFLEKKYGKPINTNLSYDYNLDNLKDIDKAGRLLVKHIEDNNKIIIVSDMDCDGITSAVTLTKGLLEVFNVNPKNVFTIVNRRKHGNGFNKYLIEEVIRKVNEEKISLIITSDHGSNDNDAFLEIKKRTGNVEIILTDHHTIKKYPSCVEVFLNPMRDDSKYIKSISGCVVAFLLLVKAFKIMFKTNNTSSLDILAPYAAISTITDCMEMSIDFNRYLVKIGLRVMNSNKYLFWNILKAKLNIIKVNETDLGFKIGPLINCGNSLNNEQLIYKMLMATKPEHIDSLLDEGISLNNLRKTLTNKYAGVIKNRDLNDPTICEIIDVEEDAILNGKIASNVGSMFNKPTIIFSYDDIDKCYVGSGRGIVKKFNILKVINKIHEDDNEIFIKSGGHEGALGCSIREHKFIDFKKYFNLYSKEAMSSDDNDIIFPDAFIPSNNINMELYERQQQYSPFGIDYNEPIYLSRLRFDSYFPIGTSIGKLNFSSINNSSSKFEGKYFFNDTYITRDNIKNFIGMNMYVAYTLKLEAFRGSYSLNLNIIRMEEI